MLRSQFEVLFHTIDDTTTSCSTIQDSIVDVNTMKAKLLDMMSMEGSLSSGERNDERGPNGSPTCMYAEVINASLEVRQVHGHLLLPAQCLGDLSVQQRQHYLGLLRDG